MDDAYIYDGLRTPIGRHAGALAPIRPDDLLAGCIQTVIERSPFAKEDVEDVVVGCTNQAGEDARNVARHAALLAGLPTTVSAPFLLGIATGLISPSKKPTALARA